MKLNIQITCQLIFEKGLEGEWLDANDVEMYLRHEKGIFLDAGGRQLAAPVSLNFQDDYEARALGSTTDIIIDQATLSSPVGGLRNIQSVKKSPFQHLFPEMVCEPAIQPTLDIKKLVEGKSSLLFQNKCVTANVTKRWLKNQPASAVAQAFAVQTLMQR